MCLCGVVEFPEAFWRRHPALRGKVRGDVTYTSCVTISSPGSSLMFINIIIIIIVIIIIYYH
jgi:hypothetical protein